MICLYSQIIVNSGFISPSYFTFAFQNVLNWNFVILYIQKRYNHSVCVSLPLLSIPSPYVIILFYVHLISR